MQLAKASFLILICFYNSQSLLAQHDIQRNAVREIARGEYDKAAKTLKSGKKPDSGPAETLYVEMLSLLAQDKIEEAELKAKASRSMGLPHGRFMAGPRELLSKLPQSTKTNDISLVHGPMIGNLSPDGASFWMRTNKEANISITIGSIKSSAKTLADNDFTAVVRLNGLLPKKKYNYKIDVDGKPVKLENTSFITPPASGKPGSFAVGFGGGGGFIPKWEYMWDTIRTQNPIAFLMLGDNVYIDDPDHDLTNHYCYSRRQSRPEWRRFTSSTAMYSIWDDHDFGLNDCVPGPEINKPIWKRRVWEIFKQNWVNPYYGGGSKQPGCWYDFYLGDVHFMLLDGRYYRDLKGGSMLGTAQKKWLKKTLAESNGTFKIIASPVPFSPNIKPGSKDPWDGFPPIALLIPVTWSVSILINSISRTVMPTSSAVIYLPPRLCTNFPNDLKSTSDLSKFGSPIITAFPPPKFKLEIEALYVIPLDNLKTSTSASSSLLYGYILHPPKAGPKTVLCIAIIAFNPEDGSLQ